jgi:uncharacterized protein YceK
MMIRSLSILLSVLLVLTLSGCASREQRAAQERERQEKVREAAAQMRTAIENRCRGYGFEKGTAAFSSCVMQMDLLTQQILAERKARNDLESRCSLARGQGYLAPTRTGNFGESLAIANSAYENCMAGLPPSRPANIICQRQERDRVYCFNN